MTCIGHAKQNAATHEPRLILSMTEPLDGRLVLFSAPTT